MAQMYPRNIEAYNATYSEKKVYNELKKQLDDRITVFYSVSWINNDNGIKKMSEADFLIFDPLYGFLTVEVKGGIGLRVENDEWFLIEKEAERKLNKSPYEQSENNMRYFKSYYEKQYNNLFNGVYGSIVIFPNFSIDNYEFVSNRAPELTIDYNGMSELAEKIRRAFLFWKGKLRNSLFTPDQKEKFLKLVQKRIALSAAAGALIEDKEKQFEVINRVQDGYIYMLDNYKQFYIKGGAGTGKTCIAIKLINKKLLENKKCLLLSYSKELSEFFKTQLNDEKLHILTIKELIKQSIPDNNFDVEYSGLSQQINENIIEKYDVIVIDEGQDFNEETAYFTRMHLKDQEESEIYVFYDDTQNLYNRSFGNEFMIDNKAFLLRENLRNTANIYSWATKNTELGKDVITNPIAGPIPESFKYDSLNDAIKDLENKINELILSEAVSPTSITILASDEFFEKIHNTKIGKWNLVKKKKTMLDELKLYNIDDFKGLESDVVFYIREKNSDNKYDYVAYTRAKFYLYEMIIK